jgi:hypothetical protein
METIVFVRPEIEFDEIEAIRKIYKKVNEHKSSIDLFGNRQLKLKNYMFIHLHSFTLKLFNKYSKQLHIVVNDCSSCNYTIVESLKETNDDPLLLWQTKRIIY